MVSIEEGKKIKTEAEEISRELCTVFDTYLKNLIKTEEKLQEIIYDIVEKTLVCKANKDNPCYPEKMYVLSIINIPVDTTLLECLGVGYVDDQNTNFVVYKGKHMSQLFFKKMGEQPDDEKWFALTKREVKK